MDDDPHHQFAIWFSHAQVAGVHEPEAVALATSTPDGRPSVRMVLLRGHGQDGYLWFTNGLSRKGGELAANAHAAIVAHWASIGRQVRVEGPVVQASQAISDAYFVGRDRRSQLGAWASHQSEELRDQAQLLERVSELDARFGDGSVPRPPHWGGWMIQATRMEFWQHGANRIHDRIEYTAGADGSWTRRLLNP